MPQPNFTYYLKIFGCQMNLADSEIISAFLEKKGGQMAEEQKADLIVAVSCGVRASAEERIISWLKKARASNIGATIVLTGCLSHRKDIEKRLVKVADLFIPIEKWVEREKKILECIRKARPKTKSKHYECDFYQTQPKISSDYRAYIPIMTGCNNFCAYCVVPYARGREKSRSPEEIIKEAKELVKKGYKELYLLGQNVNSYNGKSIKGKQWSFARLIKKIDEIPGKFWIRFISSHPKDITVEMIETLVKRKKVSLNLHLPIQSGSDTILSAMNRKYTRESYLKTIKMILRLHPTVVLSTDIIVGFPGETEKDFRESLEVVKKVGYEMLFALKYSPRPETAAFKLQDNVKPEIKIARQRKLDYTWKKYAFKKNQRYVGKRIEILIDRVRSKQNNEGKIIRYVIGKTFDNKDVMGLIDLGRKDDLIGRWGEVIIEEANALALKGKLARVKKNV